MTEIQAERPMFILKAEKRAVRQEGGEWIKDEEGFRERWGDRRPDIGIQRSQDYAKLAAIAKRYNQAQHEHIDWLFVVDVDAPVHPDGKSESCLGCHTLSSDEEVAP